MSKNVFVGLSGGVDSSLTAALLVEQGYDVTGVYMKNWSTDIGGVECPWQEDYRDAKRVAAHLGIQFEMVDFESQYKEKVVGYMLEAFKQGVTPNPDVMCNQEIKFKLFLDVCTDMGADMIATGHYARTHEGILLRAKDENKDQTYFLYRVSKDALHRTLFPLGEYTKPTVRAMAIERSLPTANRKESMGICFVGRVGIKDFLKEYITNYEPGPIVNQHGVVIGEHEGAIFYTVGQRSGLGVGGGLPYYVTSKDMTANTVYVTTDLNDPLLVSNGMLLASVHWIGGVETKFTHVRTRHRAPLVEVDGFEFDANGLMRLRLKEKVRAITPGQSTVFYAGDVCLGGGIVSRVGST